jgi:hypothetical protein
MSHDRLETAISEVKKLQTALKKSKQKQIRQNDEKDHLKAVALSWYKNHREILVNSLPKVALDGIDLDYKALLEYGDKQASRDLVSRLLKGLLSKLVNNQSHVLTTPKSIASHHPIPVFSSLVSDKKMQEILEKRWRETELCIGAKANLAATVMMGGLLEGLLLAKVNSYADKAKLFKCKSVPLDPKTGKKIELNKWTLNIYLDVAHEMTWIGKAAKDVGTVLRDYRNYIHPQKEFSHGVEVSPDDARIFWSIVSALASEIL